MSPDSDKIRDWEAQDISSSRPKESEALEKRLNESDSKKATP
jgi:hypothetical protein